MKDECCTDIDVRTIGDEWDGKGVEIMLGGDDELETFIEALRWAADNLERLANEKIKKMKDNLNTIDGLISRLKELKKKQEVIAQSTSVSITRIQKSPRIATII